MKTVGIYTLGCKVNMYESEYITNLLKANNYEVKDFTSLCDIYIINTCSVTNGADTKSKKIIRSAINRNKDACIVAMGCFIEANKDFNLPGVDIMLGTKDKSKIIELLREYFTNKQLIRDLYQDKATTFEDMELSTFPGRTRAFVKIQDGCENYCSYCIIPYVRGKCRSKDPLKVIEEMKRIIENGYQEIVLAGIHTGNYGVDLNLTFADILQEMVKLAGLKRLRISSIEATELTPDVLTIIKDNPVIANHLHIPLQAGSNEILKLMNRKYDLAYFKDKIKTIRELRPDIAISTDVIVGFPGETEELFQETIKTCQDLAFSKIHVFPYSERKGTLAMKLPNHLPNDVKKARARRLIEVSKELEETYMNKFLNTTVEVLIEDYDNTYSYGHTSNYLYVKIKGQLEHNKMYQIKLITLSYPCIIGKEV
jgi:threonylcarbamoyladenosine tRNA methylthiotransferase MtaB